MPIKSEGDHLNNNVINKSKDSEATSIKKHDSSAIDFRASSALNELSDNEQISLVNKVSSDYHKTSNKRHISVDPNALYESVVSKTRLKVASLMDEVEHLEKSGEDKSKIDKLKNDLYHQRKVLTSLGSGNIANIKDNIDTIKIYKDKGSKVKAFDANASRYEELSKIHLENARHEENKAHTATNDTDKAKYLKNAKTSLKSSKTASDKAQMWHERAEKISDAKEGPLSKAVRNLHGLQSHNRKSIDNITSKLTSSCIGSISRLFSFLFKSPAGVTMLTLLLILSSIVGESSNFVYYVKAMENDMSDEVFIEYNVWIDAYEDEGDKFYRDYHVIVPSEYLVPITYTYYNKGVYDDILNGYMMDHPFNKSSLSRSEYLSEAYKYTVSEYLEDMLDPYELRELFLDRVEYQYQYLARVYDEWAYDLEDYEGYDEVYSYEKEITVEDYDYVDHYRKMTSEECRASFSSSKDIEKCITDPSEVLDHSSYEKVGEHKEIKTFYKARHVINEYFTLDESDSNIDHDVHRINISEGETKVIVPKLPEYPFGGYSPDHEDNISDHDSYWTYMYYEDGCYIKRLRYWLLRGYEEVYNDIAYNYIPENEEDAILILKKDDEVKGDITIEIDRKYIYSIYFGDDTGIFKENVFLDEHNIEAYKQMEFLYKTFADMFSVSSIQFAEGKFLISPFTQAGIDARSIITQHFAQIGIGNKGQMHGATDFAAASGTDINAMMDGIVVNIRENIPENTSSNCALSPDSYGCHGNIGNEIEIESRIVGTDGLEHTVNIRYYHILSGSVSANGIKIGDMVKAKDLIAKVGHNGLSTGPHLHLEMKIDGQKVDCEQYIAL